MSKIVPLFPLPGVFLFPGQVMPLNVFEPRYRQMVEDMLDGPGRMVVGTLRDAEVGPDDARPAVLPVAGLGEIVRHERLPDGRFSILVYGVERVRIAEADSEAPYRRVSIESVAEAPCSDEDDERLKRPLLAAIHERTGHKVEELDDVSTGQLADVLAQCLQIPQDRMAEIFADPRVVHRAEQVLAAHGEFPQK